MNKEVQKLFNEKFFRIVHKEDDILNYDDIAIDPETRIKELKDRFVQELADILLPLSKINIIYSNEEISELEISIDFTLAKTINYKKVIKLLNNE